MEMLILHILATMAMKKFESLYTYIYTVQCTPIAVSSCRCCLSRGKKLPIANLGQVNLFVCPPRLQFVNFFRHSICFSVFDIMLVTKIRWFLDNLFSNFYCNFQTSLLISISNLRQTFFLPTLCLLIKQL